MRIIALLAAYNEERFIGACLENLIRQGLEVYLIDNSSSDQTVEIAERYRGRGLIEIETFPRHGVYSWRPLLRRKEELASTLDGDWFLHVDADEIRLPPTSAATLAEALAEADELGFNAVNFHEFTFVPTRQDPDHDHPDYQRTMVWYYPFLPFSPHRLNAWKRQPAKVDLTTTGGHRVDFPRVSIYPHPFLMRHYLFLSVRHATRKYLERRYDPREVEDGWHYPRADLQRTDQIKLPDQATMRCYRSDDHLDFSEPRTRHSVFDCVPAAVESLE